MSQIEITASALADLLEIVDRLSDRSVAAAERFITDYEAAVQQLRAYPKSGRKARFSSPRNARVLHRGVYDLLYEVREDRVVLRRIVDGRRLRRQP